MGCRIATIGLTPRANDGHRFVATPRFGQCPRKRAIGFEARGIGGDRALQ